MRISYWMSYVLSSDLAVHQRLSYIGVDFAVQARQPCFDRVDGFADAGKSKPVHDPLDGADLRVDCGAIAIRHRDRRSQIAESHMIAAQRLQSEIRVDHLVEIGRAHV